MTILLNAGNLWSDEYLDEVIRLNSVSKDIKVGAIFGSIAGLTPTARSLDRLPRIDLDKIPAYCKKAQDNGIAIRYTLNASCVGSMQEFYSNWHSQLMSSLVWLHDAVGVKEWTITSPLLVELVRSAFPKDFIEISTIAEVSTLAEALRWKSIGANAVNLSTSVNRDFNMIQQINGILQVTLLANEACLYKCPWRRECYNLSSHDSLRSDEFFSYYPFSRCNTLRLKDPVEWLKSRMILPQWMSIYTERTGISWFKVAYRTHPLGTALPILKSYMSGYHDGNLVDLWPTIAHLGKTADPRNTTHIPCSRMGNFLRKWLVYRDDCGEIPCGESCRYCYTQYDKITACQ